MPRLHTHAAAHPRDSMGGTSVLAELEELRSILDSGSPGWKKATHSRPTADSGGTLHMHLPAPGVVPYNQAINVAERSVDRLGRAIEAAEEEMEAALRRTTEVHASQLRQKEVELAEMGRLLAAKERSIDSLRDTLAATRRSFEARLAQAEAALALRESEVSALREQLAASEAAHDATSTALRRQVASLERELAEAQDAAARAGAEAVARGEEAVRASSTARSDRADAVRAASDAAAARRAAEAAAQELTAVRVQAAADRTRLEAEVDKLTTRLRNERGVRRACEKWLKSELRSREEMEVLLTAVRDSAVIDRSAAGGQQRPSLLQDSALRKDAGDTTHSNEDDGDTEDLLMTLLECDERMKKKAAKAKSNNKAGRGGGKDSSTAVAALTAQGRQVLADNARLQADLAAARRLVEAQLRRGGQ